MPEPTGGDATKTDDGKVTDTKNAKPADQDAQDTQSGEKPFDEKVFDDPRLWAHPRFKSLNDRAKKAEKLERAQAEAEEARLAEAKKFEELATKRAEERDAIQSRYTQSLQDNRIITEASKIGVVDIDTVLKMVDRSSISIDADGNISGVTEAVQSLVASKPFLKGSPNKAIGSGTNPGADGDTGIKKFKLSQLSDPKFYQDNQKEIEAAYASGQIEDDLSK